MPPAVQLRIDVHKEEYRCTGKHLDGYDLQGLLPG
jgi:hypothetical protein